MAAPVETLILVTGAAPGLGKSSLAAALVATFQADGRNADLFREEDINSERAFSKVMEEFQSTGEVQLDTLLTASGAYLTSVRERSIEVLVLDALFPYLPSLLAWGYTDDDIAAFFTHLGSLFVGFALIELHLVGEVGSALARAAEREGGDWLDRHVGKVAQFRGTRPISTTEDAVAYYDDCANRSRTLLTTAPWRTMFIDADHGPENTLAHARAAIAAAGDPTRRP